MAETKGGLKRYFKGVKSEMKKVIWPSRKELINYTGVVIFMSVLVALIVWVLDFLTMKGFNLIIR